MIKIEFEKPAFWVPSDLERVLLMYNTQMKTMQRFDFNNNLFYIFEYSLGGNIAIDRVINEGLTQRYQEGFHVNKVYMVNYVILFVILEKQGEKRTDCIICRDPNRYLAIRLGYQSTCDCFVCNVVRGAPEEWNISDIAQNIETLIMRYENTSVNPPMNHYMNFVWLANIHADFTEKRTFACQYYIDHYLKDCQQKGK